MALANSLTLRIAGVTSLTEDPSGGTIMRLPSGGNMLMSSNVYIYSYVEKLCLCFDCMLK